ncbi:MAG: CoA ester lyase [Bacteroidetes bacterium]|nr:CoA ester lyase [Bacteroidota bacterium]
MRSWLYCPADSPKKIMNAGIYGADGIVFDLEDSVSAKAKDQARILLCELLKTQDFGKTALAVRINGIKSGADCWRADIEACAEAFNKDNPLIIRVPKVESPEEVQLICRELDVVEKRFEIDMGALALQCILETPLGVEHAFLIAGSSPRIQAISFGAEDYCTAVGIKRYGEAFVLDYPRNRVSAAAAAFGIEAYDTVWGAYKDSEGLRVDAERGRALGFCGKSVIHPDQIPIVNNVFSWSEEDVLWAKKVISLAAAQGEGAAGLDGIMVDKPVLERVRRIMRESD